MHHLRQGIFALILFFVLIGVSQSSHAQGQQIIFSATGDVPYGSSEVSVFQKQMANHNKYSPSAFLAHVGDIISGSESCDESKYAKVASALKSLAVPAYIAPGDNETVDCKSPSSGYNFFLKYFKNFEQNFCGAPAVALQSSRPENWAFTMDGVLFIGVNLVYGGSSAQKQAAEWVKEQLETNVSQIRAAVVFSHLAPNASSSFSTPFRKAAATFGKPVLFVHGHGHSWSTSYPFPEKNIFRVQVNNGGAEDPVQVTVTMNTSSPENAFILKRKPWSSKTIVNMPPCVNAGPDQNINSTTATLQSGARDDGDPDGKLTTAWSQVSGPGTVTFGNANALTTTATFNASGVYVLRLTGNDSQLQTSDEVTVTMQGVSPTLAIDEVTINEGNAGTSEAVFTVSLAGGNGNTVTVDYQIVDGTATNGDDYTANPVSGTLTFPNGTTTQTITVAINGDQNDEQQDETFLINLSNATNTTIADNQGVGTIVNDDGPPPPNAPDNLTATATDNTTISLAWTDHASDEDGFKIERKMSGDSFSQIATVGVDANAYNDAGLSSGMTYVYRVRAFKGNGNSNYSNEASAATPGSGSSNLALNKTVTAYSTYSGKPVTNAVDGNADSYWRSGDVNSSNPNAWLQVDLGAAMTVSRVVLQWKENYFAKNFEMQASNDEVNWTPVHSATGKSGVQDFSFSPAVARYVRFFPTVNNKSNYRILEFEIYSTPGSTAKQSEEVAAETVIPDALVLEQNYPNPFNPSTEISFGLPQASHITSKFTRSTARKSKPWSKVNIRRERIRSRLMQEICRAAHTST